MVPEQINGTEEVYVVRRPIFQLDMDMSCLRELVFPTVMMPGKKGSSSRFGGTGCPQLPPKGGITSKKLEDSLSCP